MGRGSRCWYTICFIVRECVGTCALATFFVYLELLSGCCGVLCHARLVLAAVLFSYGIMRNYSLFMATLRSGRRQDPPP